MKTLRRWLFRAARIVACIYVGYAALLIVAQHWMIYHPRKYSATSLQEAPSKIVPLGYQTPQGSQRGFYLPPSDPDHASQPGRIMLLFGGNASLALDWTDATASAPHADRGYLFIDYPGYGSCEGSASPDSIQESTEAAVDALAHHLALPRSALEQRFEVMAHSIGCGPALNFAAKHRTHRLILISPFTSLQSMARQTVGIPFCYLLRGNFDNAARLHEIAAQPERPVIHIFHGAADTLIPPAMGETLSPIVPGTTFHRIEGAGHNDVIYAAESQLQLALGESDR